MLAQHNLWGSTSGGRRERYRTQLKPAAGIGLAVSAIVVLLLWLAPNVSASMAQPEEMNQVCRNWLTVSVARQGNWAGVDTPTIAEITDVQRGAEQLGRLYRISPRGFVLVPRLQILPPVMAYSDESTDIGSVDEGLLAVFTDLLESRLEFYRNAETAIQTGQLSSMSQVFDPSVSERWDYLTVPAREFRVGAALSHPEQAGPLMTTSWHQREPYNNLCPVVPDVGATVVGCGPIAVAQIMAFHQWPETGVGSHSYTWYREDGAIQILTADFTDPYDWGNIPDSCDLGCTSAEEAALAELCYDVAAGMSSLFGVGGTASTPPNQAALLKVHLKYSTEMVSLSRSDMNGSEWFDTISQDIAQGRVCDYTILGHGIVCDGYRTGTEGDELHMNYGWGGDANAWYVVDHLYCYWVEGDVCPYNYESTVIGVHPQQEPVIRAHGWSVIELSGDGDGRADPGEMLSLTATLENQGMAAGGTTGLLTTTDAHLSITSATSGYDLNSGWGERSASQTNYTVTVDPACPDPHTALFELAITCDGGYAVTDSLYLYVGDTPGFEDDFEAVTTGWAHRNMSLGYSDDWHSETERAYSGSTSWKCGGPGAEYYRGCVDALLCTPPLLLPRDGKLVFRYWMTLEAPSATEAYDGARLYVVSEAGDTAVINPEGDYPCLTGLPTILGNYYSPYDPYTPCISGSSVVWQQAVFDLSGFDGVVRLGFRLGTNASVGREGWYIDDVWVGNTIEGQDVSVEPEEAIGLVFDEVTERGITSAKPITSGPTLPDVYVPVPGPEPAIWDLTTTAVFSGDIVLAFDYDDSQLPGNETSLALLHHDGVAWEDVTTSIDADADRVSAAVSSLSLFTLALRTTCCEGRVGDANGLGGDEPTIGDVSVMIDAKFITGSCDGILECLTEADVNQSGGSAPTCDDVTVGDISTLIDYLFITGASLGLPGCL